MFNIREAINLLRERRPVFVSEADFQLELAWVIKELHPDYSIRLEYCPPFDRKMHIDILLITQNGWIPIELKYKTKGCTLVSNNESFVLANHSAKDVNCYLYLKDIQRIERIREMEPQFVEGYTVFLTNEPSYKSAPRKKDCVYAEFSIEDGVVKSGTLNWSSKASEGTKRGNEAPIVLSDSYQMNWQQYSKVTVNTAGSFYYLFNRIGKD